LRVSRTAGSFCRPDAFIRLRQKQIVELAERHRLPVISWDPEFPKIGGLMCYSATVNTLDQYRRAAGYVDRNHLTIGPKAMATMMNAKRCSQSVEPRLHGGRPSCGVP
jgi:hypothetical protein